MHRWRAIAVLAATLFVAGPGLAQERQHLQSPPARVSPADSENPKVDRKILAHGTHVRVHAVITKKGEVTDVKFVEGNDGLMPEVRRQLKKWKYKPYVYQGEPVEVESDIYIIFDPAP